MVENFCLRNVKRPGTQLFPEQPVKFFLLVFPERNLVHRRFQADAESRCTIAGHGLVGCFLLAGSIHITLPLNLVKMIKYHGRANQYNENAQPYNYFPGYVLLKNQSNLFLRMQI